jgi:predicted phage terminase large subunit-like protein
MSKKHADPFDNISIKDIPSILPLLTTAERERLLAELGHLEKLQGRKKAQIRFIEFVKQMWPTFISGRHHTIMAEAFERVASGECKRLIINMPPRHTKSEFASYLLPAWFLGRFPHKKVIQTAHTAELAVGFGRKVRNLVDTDVYHDVFPDLSLSADSKAAGRWNTSKGGDYFAIGVGGAVTGKGADLLIIDDPHSEQEAMLADVNPEIYDKVYEWYTSGPRQRLQPGGAIVVVMTRWGLRDLTAQVLKSSAQRGSDEWEVIEFPAILPSGNALWPEFWSLTDLKALREELSSAKWMAQYQQQPTSDTAAIVKREYWKRWELDEPPECDYILQSWDTAFEANTRSDYSACTTWGVFFNDETSAYNIIMLNAYKDRMEFPTLKRVVLEQYDEYKPDGLIVEKKASGAPLIYELRAMGIPVQDYTPVRGTVNNPNNKTVRLNAISDMFASGVVWAPQRRWADEVIDEVASFPSGEHDDYVDSTIMALMRFRQGGFLRLPSDQVDEPVNYGRRKSGYY